MMLSHLLKLVCFFLATFPTLSLAEATWKYSEPASWGGKCDEPNQSPIHIVAAKVVKGGDEKAVTFTEWEKVTNPIKEYFLKDDVTTWYVNDDTPAKMTLDGITYKFYAIYYHWGSDSSKGSEHKVNGQSYAGEAQMLFYDSTKHKDVNDALEADGGVAVLSYLLKENKELKKDRPIMKYYKKNVLKLANQDKVVLTNSKNKYSLSGVLLDDMSSYRYTGSIPFPPCKGNVEWVIVKKPMDVTKSFMKALRALKKKDGKPVWNNFRYLQDLGSRTVCDVKVDIVKP